MSRIEAAAGDGADLPAVRRARHDRRAGASYPALNATLEDDRVTTYDGVHLGIAVSLGEGGLIVPVIRDAQELSHEGLGKAHQGPRRAGARQPAHAGRGPRRHVHDHEPGRLRRAPGHADHQPAAGGDPRPRGRGQAAGGGHRRARQRLDRDPPDDVPVHVVGPPRARRRARGAVPVERAQAPRGLEWLSSGLPPRRVDVPRGASRCRSGCATRVQAGELPDLLLLLEHPPVYTRGRRSERRRAADGRGLVPRAGHRRRATPTAAASVTYHGPGQLVGYPIMRIDDVARLRAHDGAGDRRRARRRGRRGRAAREAGRLHRRVGRRTARSRSIGVHVSRGVTTHGFAVNVDNDLQPFEWIVPCGLRRRADDLDRARDRAQAGHAALLPQARWPTRFASAFGRRQRLVAPARLGAGRVPSAGVSEPASDATRSRAPTPAGCDVLEVLGADVRPFRERKPPWFKVPAPGGARYRELTELIERRGPAHGLPGGRLPERRRVLGARHRHLHDPRRHLHAPLRLLQRQDRQADLQRPARAAARRALGREDGPAPRGHHQRRPRRPARLRRQRVRRRDPLDPPAGAATARSRC